MEILLYSLEELLSFSVNHNIPLNLGALFVFILLYGYLINNIKNVLVEKDLVEKDKVAILTESILFFCWYILPPVVTSLLINVSIPFSQIALLIQICVLGILYILLGKIDLLKKKLHHTVLYLIIYLISLIETVSFFSTLSILYSGITSIAIGYVSISIITYFYFTLLLAICYAKVYKKTIHAKVILSNKLIKGKLEKVTPNFVFVRDSNFHLHIINKDKVISIEILKVSS